MTLAATVRTRSFVFVFVFILFLRNTGRGYENPYLLKRLLDITVILLMERLVRKGGNGLKGVTQAGFHRVRIPHDDLIKANAFSRVRRRFNSRYRIDEYPNRYMLRRKNLEEIKMLSYSFTAYYLLVPLRFSSCLQSLNICRAQYIALD